ncbi:MAG TPA: NADH-quinone oxidoreductase subunit H [Acidimicrobiales bacterium]|nr:NADH-quinone oxidoreductase subunit H [Acidimicrobiales bacterium]
MTGFSGGAAAVAVVAAQITAVGLGGPLLIGLMRKVRSHLEGRVGPPVHQPLLDLRKLFTKQRIRPSYASWVFGAGPVALVATAVVAVAISPLATTHPPLGQSADFFAVVFLLLLGSVALALAALDTGTSFGGMGASRAMTIGALAEPALLVAILAFSIPAHTSNLPALVRLGLVHPQMIASPERILALGAFVVVILAESGRLPVDNPSTHLELTMIHEAMVLEYAGPDLALVTLGEAMRLTLLLGLFVNLFVPWGVATGSGAIAIVVGLAALAGKVAVVGVAIATFEVFTAKMRLFRLPELLAGGFILAVLGAAAALVV